MYFYYKIHFKTLSKRLDLVKYKTSNRYCLYKYHEMKIVKNCNKIQNYSQCKDKTNVVFFKCGKEIYKFSVGYDGYCETRQKCETVSNYSKGQ